MTVYTTFDSPVGELRLVGERSSTVGGATVITSLSMPDQRGAPVIGRDWRADPAAFTEAVRQIRAYFAGELTEFDVPLASRGTVFQRRVWQALDAIPYATTTNYRAIAARIGARPTDVRAVGAAIGANPLLLLRPCHRVIGADGSMRGYAAGVARKQTLLAHEASVSARQVGDRASPART